MRSNGDPFCVPFNNVKVLKILQPHCQTNPYRACRNLRVHVREAIGTTVYGGSKFPIAQLLDPDVRQTCVHRHPHEQFRWDINNNIEDQGVNAC